MSDNNPPERREREQSLSVTSAIISSGFLPPADLLAEYRSVRPDLPDIIIEEWLKEAEARRERERMRLDLKKMEIESNGKIVLDIRHEERLRMLVGVLLYIFAFAFAGWLVYSYQQVSYAVVCCALPVISTIATAAFGALRK